MYMNFRTEEEAGRCVEYVKDEGIIRTECRSDGILVIVEDKDGITLLSDAEVNEFLTLDSFNSSYFETMKFDIK